MKYVLVLLVVIVAAWVLLGRSRGRGGNGSNSRDTPREGTAATQSAESTAQAMVACAHCQVNLPLSDTVADAQGLLFCDDAHRLAGPR